MWGRYTSTGEPVAEPSVCVFYLGRLKVTVPYMGYCLYLCLRLVKWYKGISNEHRNLNDVHVPFFEFVSCISYISGRNLIHSVCFNH